MKKKRTNKNIPASRGIIKGAGVTVEQNINHTLEENYMPYAMSVIMSRALPEIDGFKPSHRKLLYTMYKMGLLKSARTKSANIVGQTMKLNPHGDNAIYDTMVRLSRGYEALLYPYVDSKGNFGKFYSRDMACAASRYTEAKLETICEELFSDIDKDTVDFVDNYDSTLKEPTLLPTTFPSVLVNANTGIAVGMASSICPFNLTEVCETTIHLLKNKDHNVMDTLVAPDFPGKGLIVYDKEKFHQIYETGRGSFKVRASYKHDAASRCIDVLSIPPTTTCEAIIEKIVELVKSGKAKEISDVRDETGIDGMKITIDIKRGVDPRKLMPKLYKTTPLEDTFSCNFNVLIGSVPRVLGIKELLEEWIAFRIECIKRRTYFDLERNRSKLHLLRGLQKILLDIDKAIEIVRNTDEEHQVVPNLMEGFGIDKTQAEYVAEIKLRHLNREFILKRTDEIDNLTKDIRELEAILNSKTRVKTIISRELSAVMKKYKQERRSKLTYVSDEPRTDTATELPNYPVNLFFTKDGYFKKITPQSLRMNSSQKLKEGDEIIQEIEASNDMDLLFFTNKCQTYKIKASELPDSKASVMGEFIAARLSMDEEELPVFMTATKDYRGQLLFFFENGKLAKVPLNAYETKTNRRKLTKAYSDKSKLCKAFFVGEDREFLLTSTANRLLLISSAAVNLKTSRNTQGVSVMSFRKGHNLLDVQMYDGSEDFDAKRYRKKNLPSAGVIMKPTGLGEQTTLK